MESRNTFIYSLLIGLSLVGINLQGCTTSHSYQNQDGTVWYTSYHICYQGPETLMDSIPVILNKVELSLSSFNDSSLISRINRNEPDIRCDRMLTEVFNESKRINKISSGAFDPTVGPLVNLWGFGRNRDFISTVAQEQIDSILPYVGINECHINADSMLIKKHPDTEFNFSAIAKGYTCDEIGEMFRRNGVMNYLIEIGGEIVASGKNDKGEKWKVAIDMPIPESLSLNAGNLGIIDMDNFSIATSGNYRNFREVNGKFVSHTISPLSGVPVESDIIAVTIIAPKCITADALATACMAMPLSDAKEMIENLPETDALFVKFSGNGSDLEIVGTKNFPETHSNKQSNNTAIQ